MSSKGWALVTGGSRGIGRAVARRLAEDGFDVLITYREAEREARAVVDEIVAAGRAGDLRKVDLGDAASVDLLTRSLEDESRFVAILVNNAGEIRDRLLVFSSDDDLRRLMEVNLVGVMRLSRGVL